MKKRFKHRGIAIVLAAILLFSLTGSAPQGSDADDMANKVANAFNNGIGKNWVDSDVIGRVKASDEFRAQYDYAAYVNKDWIVSSDEYSGTFRQTTNAVYEKKMTVLKEMSSEEGKAAEEFRKYYELATNWDARNEQGVAPIQSYLQIIDDISSKEELYAFICDREKNPAGIAPIMYQGNGRSEKNPSKLVCTLDLPSQFLGNKDLYYNTSTIDSVEKKSLKEQELSCLLKRLGYNEKDTKKLLRNNYRMEKKMMNSGAVVKGVTVDLRTMSRKDAVETAGKYPLDEYLNSFGFKDDISVDADKRYLKKLDSLCSNGNLEKMKAMLKVQLMKDNYSNLDRDLYDQLNEISEDRIGHALQKEYSGERLENEIFFTEYLAKSYIYGAFNELYLNKYCTDEELKRLEDMVDKLKDSYREIINDEEWLSDEGKAAATEKLNNLVAHVVRPDQSSDYFDDLNLVSAEEGGNFLQAQLDLRYFTTRCSAAELNEDYDRNSWNPLTGVNTLDANAFYMANENSIYILAGICDEPFYFDGISDEELYGTLGVVVGHEMTHGFDQKGILYDKDGINQEWFPSVDKMEFNNRVMKLQSLYTGLKPFNNSSYDGTRVSAEATADMGGMRIALNIAKKKNDFDYDKFFRAFADCWKTRITEESEKVYFERDMHPLAYLRVNVTVMQFDEFHETYDVKSGDGMYLAPDKRIAVW